MGPVEGSVTLTGPPAEGLAPREWPKSLLGAFHSSGAPVPHGHQEKTGKAPPVRLQRRLSVASVSPYLRAAPLRVYVISDMSCSLPDSSFP